MVREHRIELLFPSRFSLLGCMTFVWHDGTSVFTGDCLLIRGCGRTDFQQGSADKMYTSVYKHIFSLPDHYIVYPGHDYTGQTSSTVGEEKKFNSRLTKSREEFIRIMKELKLAYPHQIGNWFLDDSPSTPFSFLSFFVQIKLFRQIWSVAFYPNEETSTRDELWNLLSFLSFVPWKFFEPSFANVAMRERDGGQEASVSMLNSSIQIEFEHIFFDRRLRQEQ